MYLLIIQITIYSFVSYRTDACFPSVDQVRDLLSPAEAVPPNRLESAALENVVPITSSTEERIAGTAYRLLPYPH